VKLTAYQCGLHSKQPARTSTNKQSLKWCNSFQSSVPPVPAAQQASNFQHWHVLETHQEICLTGEGTLVINWTETSICYLVTKHTELSNLPGSDKKGQSLLKLCTKQADGDDHLNPPAP